MPAETSEAVQYVSRTSEGVWRVAGSRVSLESVILLHLAGQPPQQIIDAFPTLTLEQVYGTIAFYLRHRAALDAYLDQQQSGWNSFQEESARRNLQLQQRIRARAAQGGVPGAD